MEHFVAAYFSMHQSRPLDAVGIITTGCIAAISDALMRKLAVDEPSEVCAHLTGRRADGRQLGLTGFGISVSSFATQVHFDFFIHYHSLVFIYVLISE